MKLEFLFYGIVMGYFGSVPIRLLIRKQMKYFLWTEDRMKYERGLGGKDDGHGFPNFKIIFASLIGGVISAYIAQEIFSLETLVIVILSFAGGILASDLVDSFSDSSFLKSRIK